VVALGVAAGRAERWVLVPIKSFAAAKGRLGGVLDGEERAALARSMAAHVLEEAAALPICVACDDDDVRTFAEARGATVAWTPGLGLNGAVAAGLSVVTSCGARYATIVHADLPHATAIGSLEHFDGVTIAPDRARRGTNLLRVPTGTGFTTRFGRDSMRRHLEECERLGLAVRVLDRDDLAFDVDTPRDLEDLPT
jgi:2-phospho-L-lactate guanylyltransferase